MARNKVRNVGGRPPYQPTEKDRSFVMAMAIQGISQDEIAATIGIAKKTLTKHFRDVLDNAAIRANAAVAANLYKQATRDSHHATTAAIYWTKARMGWREPPSRVNAAVGTYDLTKLTDDRLNALESILIEASPNALGETD